MKVYLKLLVIFFILTSGGTYGVEIPKDLSPKAEAGKKIFFEPLFGKSDYSCNSCHNIQNHCGASNQPIAPGFKVNAPTVFNVKDNKLFFWEGKEMSLRDAVAYHIKSKDHLKMSEKELLQRIRRNEGLYKSIKAAYGSVSFVTVVDALTSFLKSLTFKTKIDKFLSGNNDALTKSEYEGYILFKNLGCRDCHSGVNFGGAAKASNHGTGGKVWRVPSLRFVVCTDPYLHDGSKDNLDDTLQYIVHSFIGVTLSEDEINKLKKFLKTLGNK